MLFALSASLIILDQLVLLVPSVLFEMVPWVDVSSISLTHAR